MLSTVRTIGIGTTAGLTLFAILACTDGQGNEVVHAPAPVVTEATAPAPSPEVITEDDPRWDCREMGNRTCGVEVEGTWYVLDFATGTFRER